MPGRTVLLATVAVGLGAFVALWLLVGLRWGPLLRLDTRAVTGAHGFALHHSWSPAVSRIVTDLGSPIAVDVVTVVAAVLALARRWIATAIVIAAARLGELASVTVVKQVAERARPVFGQPLATAGGYSFPSGHAAGSAALYGVLVLLAVPALAGWRRVAVVLAGTVFVLAVAASRVLLGVHYPSDVVAGMALGVAWAAAAVAAGRLRRAEPTG